MYTNRGGKIREMRACKQTDRQTKPGGDKTLAHTYAYDFRQLNSIQLGGQVVRWPKKAVPIAPDVDLRWLNPSVDDENSMSR